MVMVIGAGQWQLKFPQRFYVVRVSTLRYNPFSLNFKFKTRYQQEDVGLFSLILVKAKNFSTKGKTTKTK